MKEQQQQQQIKELSDFCSYLNLLHVAHSLCGQMVHLGDFEAQAHVDQNGHTDFVMKE